MSDSGTFHDLLVGPSDATGNYSPGLDLVLSADIARATAQAARTWAGTEAWAGLGGFDATGAFWLAPSASEELLFRRSAWSFGWLREPDTTHADEGKRVAHDSLSIHFPAALPPVGLHAPATYAQVQSLIRELPGFAGCAFRHPANGVWKTVIETKDPTRLNQATRAFTPIAKMLHAQSLPVGRLLLLGKASVGLAFRTPAKFYGYLHLNDLSGLPAAAALTDELLRCASQTETTR